MAKGSKAGGLRPCFISLTDLAKELDMTNEAFTRKARNPMVRREVLPSTREVLLARMLLRVADRVAEGDRDQDFCWLYNECKLLAEGSLR